MGSAKIPAEALTMPADGDLTARLRQLHDEYVWRVNAAVAEGREDLAQELSDDYVDEAARILAEASAAGGPCTRPNCPDCAGARLTARARPRPRWFRLLIRPAPFSRPRGGGR